MDIPTRVSGLVVNAAISYQKGDEVPTIKFKLVPYTPEDPGSLLVFKCRTCKAIVEIYNEIDAHVTDAHPNATSVSVDLTSPIPQNRRNMSEKNVPVWALQGEDEPVQVGVASEPNADGVRSINIWPEFKKYKSKDLVFGSKPEISVTAEPKVENTPVTVTPVSDVEEVSGFATEEEQQEWDAAQVEYSPDDISEEDAEDDSEKLVIENQQPSTQPAEEAEGAQATPAPVQNLRRDRNQS